MAIPNSEIHKTSFLNQMSRGTVTETKHRRRKHIFPGIVVLVLESGAEELNHIDMVYLQVDSDGTSSLFLEVNKSLSRTIIFERFVI